MVLWKLVYPLVTTTFTQQQCTEIMQPILAQGLPLAGFIQSFPKAIVHGPWQWGRLNIPNLYMEQLISHIHMILKFGGQLEEITGSLLQASWEALQLEAGLAGNISTYTQSSPGLCDNNLAVTYLGRMSQGKHPDYWPRLTFHPKSEK